MNLLDGLAQTKAHCKPMAKDGLAAKPQSATAKNLAYRRTAVLLQLRAPHGRAKTPRRRCAAASLEPQSGSTRHYAAPMPRARCALPPTLLAEVCRLHCAAVDACDGTDGSGRAGEQGAQGAVMGSSQRSANMLASHAKVALTDGLRSQPTAHLYLL